MDCIDDGDCVCMPSFSIDYYLSIFYQFHPADVEKFSYCFSSLFCFTGSVCAAQLQS